MGNAYPNRKPTRLSFYSYSNAGCFFITICARNKEKLFGSIIGGGACDGPCRSIEPRTGASWAPPPTMHLFRMQL